MIRRRGREHDGADIGAAQAGRMQRLLGRLHREIGSRLPLGREMPPLDAKIRAEAERVIGPLTGDGNPLDAWGRGDFRTTTPYKKFDLFVTAEDSPTVSTPSGTEIMRQQLEDK